MNAHALLTSQGWRGTGHSLHASDDKIGLAKPILASKKNNTLGIGRKSHVTSDQWWLNAFDEQLKALDTSSKTGIVQTSKKHTQLEMIAAGTGKYTGANALYACFVRGGMLDGTVEGEGESTDATPEPVAAVKKESKEERRARREDSRRRKAAKAEKAREKEARKAQKAAAKSAKKSAAAPAESSKADVKQKPKTKKGDVPETKEERRARKEAKRSRREQKEKRRRVEQG